MDVTARTEASASNLAAGDAFIRLLHDLHGTPMMHFPAPPVPVMLYGDSGPGENAFRSGQTIANDPNISNDTKLTLGITATGIVVTGGAGSIAASLTVSQWRAVVLTMARVLKDPGSRLPVPPQFPPGVPPPIVQPYPLPPIGGAVRPPSGL